MGKGAICRSGSGVVLDSRRRFQQEGALQDTWDTGPEPSTELPLYSLQPVLQLLGVVVWHGLRLGAMHC